MLLSPQLIAPRQAPIVVVVSGPPTTWNPADKDATLTLSPDHLTMTGGASAYEGTRSVASASSGKKYWEMVLTTVFTPVAQVVNGIGNATANLTTFCGADTNSVGWAGDGKVYFGGSAVTTIQTWAQGDTVCFAADLDNNRIWFRTNGGSWNNGANDPATNTGGIDISGISGAKFAFGQTRSSGEAFTADFGATAFAQTAPSGFGNW